MLKSYNSGRTWKSEAGVVGLDLLAAEAEGESVVASGMFSIVWSGDSGKSFAEAGVDTSLAGMQDVTAADSQYFGIPGSGLGTHRRHGQNTQKYRGTLEALLVLNLQKKATEY